MAKNKKVSKDMFAEECKKAIEFKALFDTEQKDSRTVELSFSSEEPYERFDYSRGTEYLEVLDHGPENVDLSRLNNAHPLLLNHDPEKQIGVIEKAFIGDDKRGRAVVRFSKSQLGDEILNDVKDGIRRLVSVGYRRIKEVERRSEKDGLDVVRFSWLPHEVSIVPIPADSSVGVGREIETEQPEVPETKEEPKAEERKIEITMSEETKIAAPSYQKEAAEILAVAKNLRGKVPNVDELAGDAISQGKSVADFRNDCMNRLPELTPMQRPVLSEVRDHEWKNYSLTRAISARINGKKLGGFEQEMHDEVEKQTGQSADGLWVPPQVFATRNFVQSTGTLGGMVVETSNLGDQFIELLRNKARVLALGARVLNLNNPVTIPRQNAAGAANWTNGETTAATLSTGNFTQLTLTPKVITAFQQYSKQLLATSNPSIDMLVRDDITNIIALAIDLAALHGSGAAGQPTGIIGVASNTVNLNTNGQALGTTTDFPFLVSLESELAADNADMGSLAYLIRPGHRGSLKTTTRFASTDTPVYEMNNTINGYRAEVSNQIATNLTEGTATTICSAIFFGNWQELLLAQFAGGATDLVVDPYTLAANGVVRLIARKWVDIGVRHTQSFCIGGAIL